MYAIDTSNHTVNDKKVDTFLRTVLDGDTRLEVEAGTTGFTGACCRDAGSRTYLALLCRKGDFFFGPIKDDEGRVVGIRIARSRSPIMRSTISAAMWTIKKEKRQAGEIPVCLHMEDI